MPNDAELRRTGISFTNALHSDRDVLAEPRELPDGHVPVAPRRDAHADRGRPVPDPRNLPDVLRGRSPPGGERRGAARAARTGASLAARCGSGPRAATSPSCRAGIRHARHAARGAATTSPTRASGTCPSRSTGHGALRRLDERDAERIERDYGFADWEPPDAGEDAKAEHFGGGNAGTTQRGLGRGLHAPGGGAGSRRHDLPEPFCLVVSLVNPHDVLGYPSSYERGRLRRARSSAASAVGAARRRSTRTCATSRPCTR